MTDQDARAQVKAYAGLIDNAARHITEASSAQNSFRELNGICHKLIKVFKPEHRLVTHIVPESQLSLWDDFARGMRKERT